MHNHADLIPISEPRNLPYARSDIKTYTSSASLIPNSNACEKTAFVICACIPYDATTSAQPRTTNDKKTDLVPSAESLFGVNLSQNIDGSGVLFFRSNDAAGSGGGVDNVDGEFRLKTSFGENVRVGDLMTWLIQQCTTLNDTKRYARR